MTTLPTSAARPSCSTTRPHHAFYHPRAIDPSGGFYHFFKDDGTVYDAAHRHLVSSTRFVFTYAMAYRHLGSGLPGRCDTAWLPARGAPQRRTPAATPGCWTGARWRTDAQPCYGLAFVLLAYAHATMAGIAEAHDWIAETWELMEKRFWEPAPACTPTKPAPTGGCCRATAARTPTCMPARRCWPRTRPPASAATWSAPKRWPTTSPSARRRAAVA
jgi:mannose/cellobiose epimerase-like protein (N-acyl-D-glucosamine 2-epimerase family)